KKSNKKEKAFVKNFDKVNSPLIFRNFLTLSYSDNFKKVFYIDNEFFISKVTEMGKKQFSDYKQDPEHKNFDYKDENGQKVLLNPHRKGTSFYIHIMEE